jgi:hypothetical protein
MSMTHVPSITPETTNQFGVGVPFTEDTNGVSISMARRMAADLVVFSGVVADKK